ncbi:AAA family ATPase [Burkholderia ambifaria]|uniref:AAA family ATPase n=1 Tax=Burkholderia ambifaria TaxID=152480 RepID=UPI00158E3A7B|nr:AAA family ATPase [Burkholderia ambifaria]
MKITRIQKLQGYRIFRDFTWSGLPDFGRFNLIYGWNGAGKTSLSTLFRYMQRRTPPDTGAVELMIDGNIITGTDFAAGAIPAVRVFNRDFVDRNVFETPGHELPPVFYLGEDSTEKQQQVLALQAQRDELSKALVDAAAKKEVATTDFNTFCTNQARSIRNLLLGDPRYNNYEAPKFKDLMRRLSSADEPPVQLDELAREQLENALVGRPLPTLTVPSFANIDLVNLTSSLSDELRTTVVASTIQELVDEPQIANWVERGLHLHSTEQTHCHFCKQELGRARLDALQAHFNDHFKAQQDRLKRLLSDVESLRKTSRVREIPDRTALYPHLQADYGVTLKKIEEYELYIERYLDGLSLAIHAKMGEPFVELNLYDYLAKLDFGKTSGFWEFVRLVVNGITTVGANFGLKAMQTVVELVKAHNEYTENFERSATAARAKLEIDEGAKVLPEWSQRQSRIKELNTAHATLQQTLEPIGAQITVLKRAIRQHHQAAEELNRELTAYLGRDELRFEPKDNGYTIMRGKLPAMHLSDGERTAIAFMYFLKTLGDSDFNLKDGIVVIDDPVSSLDANSLYCAFGYMKERTKNAKQLFVLTHNFGFFRQVKNWFNFAGNIRNSTYDPARSKISHFYMLAMKVEGGQRNAFLRVLDPLLHEYESEYHYLFRCVKDGAAMDAPKSLSEVYGLPNIARRLLESFLSFRVPGSAGNLAQQMDTLIGDPAAKARIVRFLHTHSHMEQVVEPEHDLSVLSEAPAVLTDMLALIEENDKSHYDAMMKIA